MPDRSIDFDRVARYYDAHVTSTVDLEFWVEMCRRHAGPHLELMCGTGRISLAVLRAGIPLTCVDYSAELLTRLRHKLDGQTQVAAAELIEADVRELALPRRFGCIYIGFHAIAELSELDDLRRALARIAALLEPGGTALISMHEPRVRGPQCDGAQITLGTHALAPREHSAEGATVEVWGRWSLVDAEPDDGLVRGEQIYVERDASGHERARVELPVRFRLYAAKTIAREAAACGLVLRESFDGYALPPRPADADSRMRVLRFER
jgi:ubiquinone/menaquinone biosynthesis C-methylase UbiE